MNPGASLSLHLVFYSFPITLATQIVIRVGRQALSSGNPSFFTDETC